LAGDLKAKRPFWNSAVSNPSSKKLMANEFEVSASQCLTHYSPVGNGDMLDTVVHQNIIIIVSDILDLDCISVVFHILDHDKIRNLSEPIEKSTDLDQFESLASELVSPRIKINSGVEVNKAVCDFTASVASAYRLSTSKVTLSDINSNVLGLD
jgi:hypothetical protein